MFVRNPFQRGSAWEFLFSVFLTEVVFCSLVLAKPVLSHNENSVVQFVGKCNKFVESEEEGDPLTTGFFKGWIVNKKHVQWHEGAIKFDQNRFGGWEGWHLYNLAPLPRARGKKQASPKYLAAYAGFDAELEMLRTVSRHLNQQSISKAEFDLAQCLYGLSDACGAGGREFKLESVKGMCWYLASRKTETDHRDKKGWRKVLDENLLPKGIKLGEIVVTPTASLGDLVFVERLWFSIKDHKPEFIKGFESQNYSLEIMAIKDLAGDGIEDLLIMSHGGSGWYRTSLFVYDREKGWKEVFGTDISRWPQWVRDIDSDGRPEIMFVARQREKKELIVWQWNKRLGKFDVVHGRSLVALAQRALETSPDFRKFEEMAILPWTDGTDSE